MNDEKCKGLGGPETYQQRQVSHPHIPSRCTYSGPSSNLYVLNPGSGRLRPRRTIVLGSGKC